MYMASAEPLNLEPLSSQALARWYATYTAPRHEKSVLQHLESRSVESYLPLYGSTRLWNGRRAFVQLPLFPGYLFVRIAPEHRARVLEVPGVLNIVSSHGKLTPLPVGEVEALRAALETRKSEPHPSLVRGRRVRIKVGPLRGLEGVIVKQARGMRMVVLIDCIMQSFAVELEAGDLETDVVSASSQTA
jgi:transcription antitermination factor NusG